MAGRTLFNLRVHRCPSCTATLAVEPGATMVVCEYCDAHVQISRSKAPTPAAPMPPGPGAEVRTPTVVVSQPKVSAFGWVLFSLVLTLGTGGLVFFIVAQQLERFGVTELLELAMKAPKVITSAQLGDGGAPTTAPAPSEKKAKTKKSSKYKAPSKAKKSVDPAPAASAIETKTVRKPKAPEPTGPVLSHADASKQLEPKIMACMRERGVHDILAYMGNTTVGPAKVLGDARSRVDGVRAKIKGTALGKCMDQAAAETRVRAFKSNYLRFSLVNDAVPNPLGKLPEKANREEFERIIATADQRVLACAEKHGEEGAKEVFYFVIDGPSGKPRSVRASYRGRAFKKCAEAIYTELRFPKVQQWEIEITKHLQM